jgi:hypothetical protein
MTVAGYWSWFLVLGLSAWCATFGERYAISWISVGSGTAPKLFYLSRLWCSGVAVCLWLGDNIVILSMVK